jgi:rhodanese-related sulfurtransferase
MAPFPLPLESLLGTWGAYAIYLLIGFAFGYVLEISGFGNSKLLASQFYFKDLTVLKVMFGAIIVAMVLIFGASAVGLLDYNLVYVNPTYLWPGILGGLIMGFGFIIGGFCPGTSLVAAATAKLDGVFFVLGVFFGIFLFGETVGLYESFWHSSYLGRFTIFDWLGLSPGIVVILVVLMALFMFWGGEKLERVFGGKDPAAAPRWRYGAAGALLLVAVAVALVGQPSTADRWARIEAERTAQLAAREVQIHPGELLGIIHDDAIRVRLLDVRPEAEYNLFHLLDAEHIDPAALDGLVAELHAAPENTVSVLMSNDEGAATDVWKTLVAEAVPNVYILEGGVNNWLDTFAAEEFKEAYRLSAVPAGAVGYRFDAALGSRYPAAEPNPGAFSLEYTPKVKLEVKRGPVSIISRASPSG